MRAKVFMMGVLLLVSSAAFSQTEKGTFLVSGRTSLEFVRSVTNFSYDGHSIPEANMDINSFRLYSGLGYFVANNFAAGLSLDFSHSTSFPSSGEKVKTGELILMPTLMYYIPLESSVRPFVQVGAGYANATEEAGGEKQVFSGIGYGAGAGVAWFVNNKISIDLGIQWAATKLKYSEDTDVKLSGSSLGAAIGISLYL